MKHKSLLKLLLPLISLLIPSVAFPQLENAVNNPAISDTPVLPDSLRNKSRQTVGLVLSGGGAKGIAHVGVIKALEDNGIPFDYVTGTSMGAIVGSLYACGWSPDRMMDMFTSKDFGYWSSGTINPADKYYFTTPDPTPQWLSLNVNPKDTADLVSQIIPTSLINPLPMNMEFLKLYSPYTEQCGENFNNLFVPFRCVTSDVYHKRKIVCYNGSLGDAVRASMSFPLVFKPIKLHGLLVYDGGIYDNFPVNVMENDFDPDFIIGVSVSAPNSKPKEGDVYSQLEDMIIQNNDYSVPSEKGIKIQVPVLDFGVLDFGQAEEIYSIGYKTGLAMVDSIKKRVTVRVSPEEVAKRRERFASHTPVMTFDSVIVTGAKPNQAHFLEYLFEKQRRKNEGEITMQDVQDVYYRVVTDGKFSDLLPQAIINKDGKNTLLLQASVKNPYSLGVGGWVSSSTNSMLYLNLGYHTLSFNSLDLDLSGWLGQSYYAGKLSARFTFRSSLPSYVQLDAVLSRQKYYDSEVLFYETTSPSFVTELQGFLRAGYCWAIGRRAKGWVNIAYGWENDKFYSSDKLRAIDANKDESRYKAAVLKAGVEMNTLNDQMYPSEGKEWNLNILAAHEDNEFITGAGDERSRWHGHYFASAELLWRHYFPLHNKFRLGVSVNGLATLQNLYSDYTASMVHAVAFAPTPSTRNYFNVAFRNDNYGALGLSPVWLPFGNAQLRGDFYAYCPLRHVVADKDGMARFDGWFKNPQFLGEVSAVYNFSFASLSIYVNYLSSPSHNWNFGINFGLYFQAPRLLR